MSSPGPSDASDASHASDPSDSDASDPSDSSNPSDPRRIGEVLDRVLAGLGTPGVRATKTVFGDWEDLVGPAVAAHARPVSLDHGCLLVAVDDPGWATRFRYEEAGLIERLAAELGADVIRRIEVRVSPR